MMRNRRLIYRRLLQATTDATSLNEAEQIALNSAVTKKFGSQEFTKLIQEIKADMLLD